VVWLYDLYANHYDDVKNYQSLYEHALLADPIMDQVAPHTSPLILDVATGTGRLPLAMLNHTSFQGRVIGVDLSRRMLRNAADKLNGYGDHVTLMWCPAEKLPFADSTFDVVTSLESLEFMSNPQAVVAEMIRVLRPSGLLLMTNRIGTRLMPGKTWSKEQLTELLSTLDLDDAYVEAWQVDYHKVWAVKSGDSQPTGKRPLGEILRCPCCNTLMVVHDGAWVCEKCGGRAAIGHDGVIELFPLQESC
jgi:ubiquinone/menaquinone biosynthesis C-methylase UbiE